MKKLKMILAIVFLYLNTFSRAQDCGISYSSDVLTFEVPQFQNSFEVDVWLNYADSIKLLGAPWLDSNAWFTLSSFTQPDTTLWYDTDSINFSFELLTDTNNLSFYAQKLTFNQKVITDHGSENIIQWNAWIYFTPWRTVEIWNESEYYGSGRSWKIANPDSSEPTRVYFSKSFLPTSTYSAPDSIINEWETEYLTEDVSDAPFFIRHAPIHPDTMEYYCDLFGDSAWQYYQYGHPSSFHSSKSMKTLGKTFDGSVTGRLMVRTVNDLNDVIDMPLRGIYVKLKEKDGLLWQDFGETHTDDNGNFTINFSRWQTFAEGDNLEFYIKYKAKNDEYNFEVIRPTFDGLDIDIFGQAVFADQKINKQADNVTQNIGDVFLGNQDVGFLTFHYFYNCYDYIHDNSGSTALKNRMSNHKLSVMLETNTSSTLVLPSNKIIGGLYFKLDQPTIRLKTATSNHESTIYHEFGHYLMWTTQNFHFINIMDDTKCPNVFEHHQEMQVRKAWTEGFANFTRYMFDAAYWQQDNEYSWKAFTVGQGSEQNEYRRIVPSVNNGFRSEDLIGMAMYDLWDGPNKNLPDPNNTSLVASVMNLSIGLNPHPFNDQGAISSLAIDNAWVEPDNIELSLDQILKPILDRDGLTGKIQNINEYYHDLKNNFASDCISLKGISQSFRENRIMQDISSFERGAINGNTSGNWGDINLTLSSDDIFIVIDFEDSGKDMFCISHVDEMSFYRNPVETVTGQSTEFPNPHWNSSDYLSEFIIDSLRLGFNFPNSKSSLLINSGFTTESAGVNMNTCSNVVWQFGNTLVKIGSHSSPTAQVHFNAGSQFITGSNTVIHISDNSKLTIEEGATLQIGAGTQIILDGSNAILEIKGKLILDPGASLAPQAGSNGLGFVRFNMAGIANANQAKNRIQMGTGSKIEFSGTSSTQKLVEVTDHVLWLDNNNDNSKTFTIDNGKIEMGENAVLNLGLRSIFNEAHIEPIGGTTDFKGVYLWGHRNTINNLQIKDCRNGLKCTNIVGGYPLLANGLVLDNCTNSLWVEGKGMVLKNSNIKNGSSAFGINVTGADLPSVLQTTLISHVDDGVLFKGNKTATLSVTGSTLNVAINGIDYKAPGTLFSRCSNYYGNDAGTGIKVAAGSLELANAFGRTGGGNRFYNTSTSTAFNKSLFLLLAPIYLHNGINDLKFFAGSGNWAIFGRTKNVVIGGNINASQNFWALPPNATPTLYTNYLLFNTFAVLGNEVNVASPANPFTIQSTFDASLATFCSNPTSSGGSGGTGNALIANPRNITWQSPNQNVKDVFEEILTNQYDTLYTSNIIPDWQSALTAAEWNVNMQPIDWDYIDLGITKMNEIAALYLNTDTAFLDQPDTSNTYLSALSNVLNFWKARSDTSSSAEGQLVSQHIKFSKAGIYTLTNHYAKANEIYTDLATTGDSSLFPLAEYWICQIYRMNQIKDTGTHYMFVDSIEPCTVVYPENYPEPFKEDVLIKGFNKPQMVVYPNPTNKIVNIQLTESTSANMIIFNSLGQLVLEKQLSKSDKWSVDISMLPKGIYSIKIYMNESNATLVQKLIVD